MARLEVRYDSGENVVVVGNLLAVRRSIFFQYDEAFRARRLELSPFKLPTSIDHPVEEKERTYHGLHGLFNDSLPDGWGMIVIERASRARGIRPELTTPLDRLAFLGSRTMGALTYHPSSEGGDEENLEMDITEVAEQSQRLLEGSIEQILPEIVKAGGSPMGARPKILAGVRDDFNHLVTGTGDLPTGYSHWLIKFAAREDPEDIGSVEMAYSEMGRRAGISVPRTHLFDARNGRRYFGVQRFDRDPTLPSRRIHTHTFAGLVHHDHRIPGQDYHDLLRVTQILTKNHEDVLECFRRMVFNVLAHNRDDHTKNFAFQMAPHGDWSLAPAYDVTYSAGPGGEHTLMVNGAGQTPTWEHIEAVADGASLDVSRVSEVIEAVKEAISQWEGVAKTFDVSNNSRREIQAGINRVRESCGELNNKKRRDSKSSSLARRRR